MSYLRLFLFHFILCITQTGYGLSDHVEARIVKGYKVDINHYPHSVFLHFKESVPTGCGASLIIVQAVLTAAHCLDQFKYQKGQVTAFFGGTLPVNARAVRHVYNYRIHPKYDPKKGRHNLGVAFLNLQVPLGDEIQKIPLAFRPPKLNDRLLTSGWGKQVPDRIPDYSETRHLKVSQQRIISHRECQNFTGFEMSSAYWCTVSINGYHYQGDAGNGLVSVDRFLVGVVSYMVNEATIYTDVIRQTSWLMNSLLFVVTGGQITEKCSKRQDKNM